MRADRPFLGWGVFLLALGAVPLAARLGLIGDAVIRDAWQLWPVALIALGLALVAGRVGGGALPGIVAAGIFGLAGGLVFANGVPAGLAFCGGDERVPVEATERTGTFGASAIVEVDVSCGELVIVPGEEPDWRFLNTDVGEAPELSAGPDRLRIKSANSGPFVGDRTRTWRLTLPAHMDIGLSTTVDAGTGYLDLTGLDLRSLSLTGNPAQLFVDASKASLASFSASVNAGKLTVALPAGPFDGSISANAGAVELCVPAGVGLAVESSESLGSTNLAEAGLTRQGDRWRNAAYDTSTNRIEPSVSVNAGSLTLNPEGGCQ